YARTPLRGAAERPKPNTERLREYRDAALARIAQRLTAPVPVYPALDTLTLSFALERMREWLGPDDAIVRALLAKDSPDALAARLVDGSQLADPKLRQRLREGGARSSGSRTWRGCSSGPPARSRSGFPTAGCGCAARSIRRPASTSPPATTSWAATPAAR